ncbi:DNA repair exonuclease [Megasphaera sp. UPII 135-E]|uniref:metallophosphoesterase family protein n=1 Tax=Megasphaera sp. UPII 135-E TaxID=1000569 RepID=UPI00021A24A4|nr:DNA repair exonuclease [Megasphaera sp. UPII 135-E]EGS32161.1 Ser/Thr phosphatase family protein [Megasphaera sp. UPII 135-E]MUP48866.1 DNA repair exonuclease [Veillonellaceae bacterium M2-8]MUP59512.1 DNA repair exonuclease [Veillonellaceae bacterium M2-4]
MAKGFRFIQCGDLHLGSPFRDLVLVDERWKQSISKAPVRAFQKIVQLAIEKKVHAVFITGDVYTSREHNLTAQLDYVRLLHQLAQHHIEVFAVLGNHDPLEAWKANIPLPANVHVFSTTQVERVPLVVEGEEVAAIYGQSYAKMEQRENIAKQFHRSASDTYAIGLLHTQVGNLQSTYAPCTIQDLCDSGMDYWALGHVHKKQILHEKPYIVYAGNPQGLDCTEIGERGCYYVEVGPYGTTELTFFDTSVVCWETVELSIDSIESVSEMRDAVRLVKEKIRRTIGKPTFLTIDCVGQGSLYPVLNNQEATQYWLDSWHEEEKGKYAFVMVERLRNLARPKMDISERGKLPDTVGDYLNVIEAIENLSLEKKTQVLRDILTKRPEIERLGRYSHLISDERLVEAFEKAKWVGIQQLMEDRKG